MSNPFIFPKVSDFSLVSQYNETVGGIGLEVLRVPTLYINNIHCFLDAFCVAGAVLDALQVLSHLILNAISLMSF